MRHRYVYSTHIISDCKRKTTTNENISYNSTNSGEFRAISANAYAKAYATALQTYSGGILDSECHLVGQGPVIKDSPGTILTIHAGGRSFYDDRYVLLFNKTTQPQNGDVPAIVIPLTVVYPQIPMVVFAPPDRDYPGGLPMTTGISWALSSTPSVLSTPTACTQMTLTVTYK